jgi:hypothetical protein
MTEGPEGKPRGKPQTGGTGFSMEVTGVQAM